MERSWAEIWECSEFWRQNDPARHFDTPSTLAGPLLARWLLRIAADFNCATIMEIGFGNGHIQSEMALLKSALPRIGVDIRRAPAVQCRHLIQQWDTRSEDWRPAPGNPHLAAVLRHLDDPVLVFAVEWLDDVAAPIAVRDNDGDLHAVGPAGGVGGLGGEDTAWAERWWPQPGLLAVGRSRDVAWAWLARNLPPRSVLLTVDYGHVRARRPRDGGFVAYREGRRIPPDETANLTAAVSVDSLAAAVEKLGCERQAYARLAELPATQWRAPGEDSLTALALRSQEQLLRDPRRFGGFWLVQHLTPESASPTAAGTAGP